MANIVFGGSGASRTVTITPALNQSGTATITITVTDGDGGTASDTFVLTVTAANDPPTISDVADTTTPEDTPTAALAFTVGDAETPAGGADRHRDLLEPDAGAGGEHRLRRQWTRFAPSRSRPAPNQSGTATITITVTDADGGTASDTFVLTVTAANDPPTISDVPDHDHRGHGRRPRSASRSATRKRRPPG